MKGGDPVEDVQGAGYLAVGHVTIDVLADGSRRAGGSAFYAALQAARLGARAGLLTRGRPAEIEAALGPLGQEIAVEIEPAAHTTMLATSGSGSARVQRVASWAGPIPAAKVDPAVLHLAPVAAELGADWVEVARAAEGFVGLTPQGLARRWEEPDGPIELTAPGAGAVELAACCDALVLSEHELPSCAALVAAALRAGASVAVTAGARPTRLLAPDGTASELDVPPAGRAVDDLGAGDVFAAAFFLALAEGGAPVRAAAFAQAAASLRVRALGAGAIARREDVVRHAAELERLAPRRRPGEPRAGA